jgi:hypothetical protein
MNADLFLELRKIGRFPEQLAQIEFKVTLPYSD